MKVLVVDGAGGNFGQQIVARLVEAFGTSIDITVLGTNAAAVANMLKAGANRAASGENAFRVNTRNADLIIGSVAIMTPNSYMGELTPSMVEFLTLSKAKKVLLPLGKHYHLVGASDIPIPRLIDETIKTVKSELNKRKM